MMNRGVFLDRDGTLIVEKSYLSEPDRLELIEGSSEGLRALVLAGFRLFLVTNQSGIGRGYYSEADMHRVHERLAARLRPSHVRFEKIYFAPEAPEQPSYGRKPSPQFLFDARDAFGIDLRQSYMVGDKITDVECGRQAGLRGSVLVRTGFGREHEAKYADRLARAVIVDSLTGAVEFILRDANLRAQG